MNNVAKLDKAAACFEKAGAAASSAATARRDRIRAITSPAPVPSPTPTAMPIDSAPPVGTLPKPTPTAVPLAGVLSEGDSISVFWGGNHTGLYATAHPNVVFHGNAVGGAHLEFNPANDLYSRFDADAALHPALVTFLIGGNDIPEIGLAWSAWKGGTDAYLAELFGYAAKWKATGAHVIVGTILPQCRPGVDNTLANANRAVINAAIRAAVGSKVDGIYDFAADPTMGPDAAACDTTLYQDGLHPTDPGQGQGGQAILAPIYARAVDLALSGAPVAGPPAPDPTATPTATATPAPVLFKPTPSTTATLDGVPPIPSEFDPSSLLVPSWDTPTMAPDVVGAFRFQCVPSHNATDDPIVYPNQPGRSHLHTFFGNTLANASSTYESLRTSGDSTCNNMLNRSAYWIPAMMNGQGKVVMPNYVNIYYKRRPDTDPYCKQEAPGGCIGLPRGLRYIFGYKMATGEHQFSAEIDCLVDNNGLNGIQRTIPAAAKNCPVDKGWLELRLTAPSCWDGKTLDAGDHMSHMAYPAWIGQPYEQCPAGYPYVVPAFTIGAFYKTDASLNTDGVTESWYLASDRMPGMPQKPAGSTFHSDWFGAWDDSIMQRWMAGCINKLLSCSGGPLGDGYMMRMDKGYTFPQTTVLVDPPTA